MLSVLLIVWNLLLSYTLYTIQNSMEGICGVIEILNSI